MPRSAPAAVRASASACAHGAPPSLAGAPAGGAPSALAASPTAACAASCCVPARASGPVKHARSKSAAGASHVALCVAVASCA
eukprot:2396139-Prymnesium_polylepis.1